jgi:hypothetical protein
VPESVDQTAVPVVVIAVVVTVLGVVVVVVVVIVLAMVMLSMAVPVLGRVGVLVWMRHKVDRPMLAGPRRRPASVGGVLQFSATVPSLVDADLIL